jgi:hypothetical protein
MDEVLQSATLIGSDLDIKIAKHLLFCSLDHSVCAIQSPFELSSSHTFVLALLFFA